MRFPKPTKPEKPARRIGDIRHTVALRAGGKCEHCGQRFSSLNPPQLDHWLGGNGRRRQMESVETCWMLCMACHVRRTTNRPSASYWNDAFRLHCQKYGYKFTPHIEHVPVVTSFAARKEVTPAGLSKHEPPPQRNEHPAVWDLVVADMRERDATGAQKYGTRLQPFNGRDVLVDSYQEALDLVVYLRQAIFERDRR